MNVANRDKIRETAYPQQVPWPSTNEDSYEGQKLGRVKKSVIKDDQDWKDRMKVSSSRVQAHGAPPSGNGASSLTSQTISNGQHIPRTTNSTRQVDHTDSQSPGAVVYGSDEDARQYIEDSENGPQPIIASVEVKTSYADVVRGTRCMSSDVADAVRQCKVECSKRQMRMSGENLSFLSAN